MRLLNGEVKPFGDFILSQKAKGKESRLRVRFVKLLDEHNKQIDGERIEILKQYAKLNEDGSIKVLENNMADVTAENIEKYNQELYELMTEEWVLDDNEERKEMFLAVKDLILNCDEEFSGQSALDYDRWCEIVESVHYDN